MRCKMMLLILFVAVGLSAQSSDPLVAPIIEALSHPTQAHLEVNTIRVDAGTYTHCETHGSSSDCEPRTKFHELYQLVLTFELSGKSIKVLGGCDPFFGDRHCHEFSWLGEALIPNCRTTSKGVYVCTTTGSKEFVIERKKREYFIYPVEGGKPNRHYYIPLMRINDIVVSVD